MVTKKYCRCRFSCNSATFTLSTKFFLQDLLLDLCHYHLHKLFSIIDIFSGYQNSAYNCSYRVGYVSPP